MFVVYFYSAGLEAHGVVQVRPTVDGRWEI